MVEKASASEIEYALKSSCVKLNISAKKGISIIAVVKRSDAAIAM